MNESEMPANSMGGGAIAKFDPLLEPKKVISRVKKLTQNLKKRTRKKRKN